MDGLLLVGAALLGVLCGYVGGVFHAAGAYRRELQDVLDRQDAHERAMWASVARSAAESKGRSKEEWEGIFLDLQHRMHRLEREQVGPHIDGMRRA